MNNSKKTIALGDCLLHEIRNHEFEFDETKIHLSWENLTVRTSQKSSSFIKKTVKKIARLEDTMEKQPIDLLKSGDILDFFIDGKKNLIRINRFFSAYLCLVDELLIQVCGFAESGQMIAVMGPSGAGKTTLLEVLAKKIEPTSGTIRVNGMEMSSSEISKISSHVPQFDPLPEFLTVDEYIAFSCALRLDERVNSEERSILARDITLNLSLFECKDSLIRTLSGGEKKRLSLAAETVTKPRILYLDEPTTGLDTSAALHVVESIKQNSTKSIVICSIHQPSMMIYKLFSHVIFLTEGKVAFAGRLKDARAFFESQGFSRPVAFDEAEYYVKILAKRANRDMQISNARSSQEVENYSTKICRAYDHSGFSKIPTLPLRSTDSRKFSSLQSKPPWIVQFKWLIWRYYHENRRTFVDGLISFNYFAISMILVIIFFWGIDTRKAPGIQDVMGVLYMTSAETIFSTAYTPLYEIESKIAIFRREATMYCPSVYYVTTLVSWLPKTFVKSFVLTIMLFAILSSQDSFVPTFLRFFACSIVSGICALAYGSMMGSLIEDSEMATIVMVPIDLISFLMSGIFYNLRTLKWYTVAFKHLSMFYYTNEALAIAHWSQIDEIECPNNSTSHCVSSGSEVLSQYGFDQSNFWFDILVMVLLAILMNFVGYLGMKRRRSSKCNY